MKILHTSDIHVNKSDIARIDAIKEILNIAKEEKVDCITISGDLFDSDIDGETQINQIRSLFQNNPFKIVAISGNHDMKIFEKSYFGSDVIILNDIHKPEEFEDFRVWGFPFENISEVQIYEKLEGMKAQIKDDKINILLFHGHLLDIFDTKYEDFGDEEKYRYMPVKLSFFSDLKFNYILAGHFHRNTSIKPFGEHGDKFFIYPGSPISITRNESGPRNIIIISSEKPPINIELRTRYYCEEYIELDPNEQNLDGLQQKLQEIIDLYKKSPKAEIQLTISGFTNYVKLKLNETQLANLIKEKLINTQISPIIEFTDQTRLLESKLFKKFMDKLTQSNLPNEEKKSIQDMFIQAAMGVEL